MIATALRALPALLIASAASAADPPTASNPVTESNFTLYTAYRAGGHLTDAATGGTIAAEEHSSFAAALDLALDPGRQTQIFYSRQKSALVSQGLAGASDRVPITIEYLHIGGTSFLGKSIRGTYLVGGIGATRATPDFGGLHSATRLSMNLGLGYLLRLGGPFAARFEVRGYGTLVNSEGGLFCGGDSGCVISVKGDALYQTEALIGLSGRF